MTTYISHLPPAQNSTYVKASSSYPGYNLPYFSTDPALPLIGTANYNQWQAQSLGANQKFNIDHGAAFVIKRIYIENSHVSGANTDRGVRVMYVYGTNSADAFANVTYADTTDLTLLATLEIAQHVASNVADPQYHLIDNSTAYRYTVLRCANTWGGSYLGFRHIEIQSESSTTLLAVLNQLYTLENFSLRCLLEQPYHLTSRLFAKLEQIYGLQLLAVLAQHYGDAKSITKFLEQYYSSSRSIIKILEQVYGKEIRTIVQLQQAFTLIGNIIASSNHSYSITEQIVGAPLKLSQNYNLELLNSIVSGLRQNWNITSNILLNNTVDYKVAISGVQVPSENVNINCDIEQHYIEGTFTLHKPDYFPLCIKKANVVITITVGSDTIDFHLLLWEKTRTTTVNSTIYTLTCRSQSVLLDSKYSPTLQKEFPANLASTTVAELAAIHSIPVNWNVYESGQLVDELIPAGYLFANNEKPLAVIRKILEPLGAIMQSTPEGGLEIMHVYPKKVPSYQTETIDIDLKEDIRYENVSTTSEERSGVNTVYVSDQLTSNTTYNLEEEVVSSIAKYVKGFHTPWDSEEVYLATSGGESVLIEYLGVVTENMPPADSELPYELIEFVNGTGNVSKPIYTKNTIEWVMDSLGGITFAEDGTLTSEIPGESLLKITYTTKYHKWLVTSPNIKDIQCILRPLHE